MIVREENLEHISRIIGDYYSGGPLSEKLKRIGVPENIVIYPNTKWRMVFDVMCYCSSLQDENKALKLLGKIIELVVHPLNFATGSMDNSAKLITDFNKRLAFDKVAIREIDGEFHLVKLSTQPEIKTSTDYIKEVINYFKDEYNKVKISGISYSYSLGENINSDQVENGRNGYEERLEAIEQLRQVGFIREYKVVNKVECDGYYVWDYAVCKIDESKLTQREEQEATDFGAEAIAQKVIKHEHIHRFENSIQEKEIDINLKSGTENKIKKGGSFPFTIPAGAVWENFYIQFKNEEAVTIKVAGHIHDTSYADMGFVDGRTGRPNTQWLLLKLLAKVGGSLPASSPDAEQRYKKQKQVLSDKLKEYFKIDFDPFKPYSKKDGYVIKINLSYPSYPQNEKNVPNLTLDDEIATIFKDLTE